jgi:hypothetical protein
MVTVQEKHHHLPSYLSAAYFLETGNIMIKPIASRLVLKYILCLVFSVFPNFFAVKNGIFL